VRRTQQEADQVGDDEADERDLAGHGHSPGTQDRTDQHREEFDPTGMGAQGHGIRLPHREQVQGSPQEGHRQQTHEQGACDDGCMPGTAVIQGAETPGDDGAAHIQSIQGEVLDEGGQTTPERGQGNADQQELRDAIATQSKPDAEEQRHAEQRAQESGSRDQEEALQPQCLPHLDHGARGQPEQNRCSTESRPAGHAEQRR